MLRCLDRRHKMAAFNPSMLKPAAQVAEFSKASGAARTAKQVAIDNIKRQMELTGDAEMEGRRTFEVVGDKAKFSVRVNNTALVLETLKEGDKTAEVTEMSCPAASLKDAFAYYLAKVEAGDFDAQLAKLEDRRGARAAKAAATRAAKPKTAKDKKAA